MGYVDILIRKVRMQDSVRGNYYWFLSHVLGFMVIVVQIFGRTRLRDNLESSS